MGAKQRDFSEVTDESGIPVSASSDGLAIWLGISPRAARAMCSSGTVPAVKVGRAWRVNLPEALRSLGLIHDGEGE